MEYIIMREGISYLKVKAKSLQAEAKIIRQSIRKIWFEESQLSAKAELSESVEVAKKLEPKIRQLRHIMWDLKSHLRNVVLAEYRSTMVAMAFVKGRPYSSVERFTRKQPDWARVEKIAKKYGAMKFNEPALKEHEIDPLWQEWFQSAKDHVYLSNSGIGHMTEKRSAPGREKRELKLEALKAEFAAKNAESGKGYAFWGKSSDTYRDETAVSTFVSGDEHYLNLNYHAFVVAEKK